MKRVFCHFCLSICVVFTCFSQDFIIAGQTIGANIHYTDFVPDSSIYLGQNNDGFMLDIDNNGTYDLLFNIGINPMSPDYFRTWSTVQILNENVKICLTDNVSKWVKNLNLGDTISENNIWVSAIDSLYYFHKYLYNGYPPNPGGNYQGEFGNGFMGFQMNFHDGSMYGWINIKAGAFYTLEAKDMAICYVVVDPVEINNPENAVLVFPNPFNDMLYVESYLCDTCIMRLEIINFLGAIVKTYYLENEKSTMNTSFLPSGLYLVRIKEGDKIIYQTKKIKI